MRPVGKRKVNGFEVSNVTVHDIDLFSEYHKHKDYNLLTFNESFPLLLYGRIGYKIIDDYLCVFRIIINDDVEYVHLVGMPSNIKGSILDLDSCFKILHTINANSFGRIMYVNKDLKFVNSSNYKKSPMKSIGAEYILENKLVKDLSGGNFGEVRNKYNKFKRLYDIEVVPFSNKLKNDALDVYNLWEKTCGMKYDKRWDRKLFMNIVEHYEDMNKNWLMFMLFDKKTRLFVGIFDAFIVNDNVSIRVSLKMDTRYLGISEFCQIELSKTLFNMGNIYSNIGADGNFEGLRSFKEKFSPIMKFDIISYRAIEQ